MTVMNLSHMQIGQRGVIQKISGISLVMQRLLEMGLTPGTKVEVVRFAPLGDPMEIEIRGYRLSIRKQDALLIDIALESSEGGT